MKFLAGLFFLAYAPGRALLAVLKLDLPRLETVGLSLVAGMAATTTANKLARLAGMEAGFALWVAAGALFAVSRFFRRPPRPPVRSGTPASSAICLGVIGLLVLGLLAVDSFTNACPTDDGSFLVKMRHYDGFIRQAVIRELSHDLPPEMPFAAGRPLGYHYGMDLFIALFNRYLGLDVWDLVHRLLAPVFWLLLVLSAYLFSREASSSETAGVLAAALVVFGGGGLSWLADLLFGTPAGANPFYALYLFDGLGVNSFIPGMAILFSALFALARYLRERLRGWLVLAALLFALSVEFKVFFAGPVIGALSAAGLVVFLRKKDGILLTAAAATAAAMAPLLLSAYFGTRRGTPYAFSIEYIDWPGRILETLKLEGLAGSWKELRGGGPLKLASLGAAAAAWILTAAGSLGLSAAALPVFLRRLFAWRRTKDIHLATSILAAASWLYFFVFRTKLGSFSADILNVYVFYLGLILLLTMFAEVVAGAAARTKGAARAAVLGAALLLSVPSTAAFLRAKIRAPEPRVFPAAFVDVARWLNRETPGRSVVLQPLGVRYLSYFGGRRVVLDDAVHSYLDFHLPAEDLSLRRDAVNRFFASPSAYPWVLGTYGVTHVVVPVDQVFPVGGKDGEVSLGDFNLRRIFANAGFVVYEVGRPIEKRRA
ncbi:MAG: hypothetical protein FJY82_13170 [Candidatus Aminicenantes bacterium]|nr:hypothetical protein [Candidatus Aminicenantes bacterium]